MALTLTIPCRCWHGRVKSSLPSASGEGCQYPSQAVRALPIRIITVGKKRSPGVQLLVDDYIGKLKHYCHVDDVVIRSNPKNTQDVRAQVDDEDGAIMNLIGSDDWVVMLDERGLHMGSEQLAGLVGNAGNTGASRLSFCIGGPYGLGRQVRERADISIKLSSMVLNHQIALVVLMEQLYRIVLNNYQVLMNVGIDAKHVKDLALLMSCLGDSAGLSFELMTLFLGLGRFSEGRSTIILDPTVP